MSAHDQKKRNPLFLYADLIDECREDVENGVVREYSEEIASLADALYWEGEKTAKLEIENAELKEKRALALALSERRRKALVVFDEESISAESNRGDLCGPHPWEWPSLTGLLEKDGQSLFSLGYVRKEELNEARDQIEHWKSSSKEHSDSATKWHERANEAERNLALGANDTFAQAEKIDELEKELDEARKACGTWKARAEKAEREVKLVRGIKTNPKALGKMLGFLNAGSVQHLESENECLKSERDQARAEAARLREVLDGSPAIADKAATELNREASDPSWLSRRDERIRREVLEEASEIVKSGKSYNPAVRSALEKAASVLSEKATPKSPQEKEETK